MAGPPAFSAEDFRQALLALMPRGRVWPRETDSLMARMLGALSPSYARSTLAANALIAESLPTTTNNLLPEWEASLGLPADCTPPGQTTGQRKAAVAARWAARGGQTPAYFITLAAALGYSISIVQYAPARIGSALVGDPLYDAAWAHAWSIEAAPDSFSVARVGTARVGDTLRAWGNVALECAIAAAAPAHTLPLFQYTPPPEFAELGLFTLDVNQLA